MNRSITKLAPVFLLAAVALAGCGSSGGDDGGGSVSGASEVPQSALDTVPGLIAYMNDVINNMTSNTSEPILVGNAVLPTSDTTEPVN